MDLSDDDEGDTNTERGKQFFTYFGLEAEAYDEELFQVGEIDTEKRGGEMEIQEERKIEKGKREEREWRRRKRGIKKLIYFVFYEV